MKEEIENAKITETLLGIEDHGCMTIMLTLELSSGGSIGFGGYNLTGGDSLYKHTKTILGIVGVDYWEKVKGKYIRIKKEAGYHGKIIAIGNLMEDKWFNPKELPQ